jgi:regulator of replication initiation timing
MKIDIPTRNSINKQIDKKLEELWKEINKLKARILDLEEENRKLRFVE